MYWVLCLRACKEVTITAILMKCSVPPHLCYAQKKLTKAITNILQREGKLEIVNIFVFISDE